MTCISAVFLRGGVSASVSLEPLCKHSAATDGVEVSFRPNSSPTLSGGGSGAVIAVFNPPRLEAPHKTYDGFSSGCRRVKVQSALIRASLVSSAHSGQHRALREHRKRVRPAGLPIPGPGSLLLHQRVLAEGGTDTMTVESIYESFLTLLMAGIKSGTVC